MNVASIPAVPAVTPPPATFNFAGHLLQVNAGRGSRLAFVDDFEQLLRATNDNGRRTIARTLRVACGRRTTVTWRALYALDGQTPERRRDFLRAVESSMAAIR